MLDFYSIRYDTYHNEAKVGAGYAQGLFTETEVESANKELIITWDNLDDFYQINGIFLPFNVWNFKRGRVISFFEGAFTNKNKHDIKEWKEPTNLTVRLTYVKQRYVSIEDALKWDNVDKAIQYLKEKGLSVDI